jgi:hypothetical protein
MELRGTGRGGERKAEEGQEKEKERKNMIILFL